jgi:hypothetical protein
MLDGNGRYGARFSPEFGDGVTFSVMVAAFDARAHGPGFVTGSASRRIARRLRRRGARIVSTQSFFVEKNARRSDGEDDRARAWGASLASLVRQPLMTA